MREVIGVRALISERVAKDCLQGGVAALRLSKVGA